MHRIIAQDFQGQRLADRINQEVLVMGAVSVCWATTRQSMSFQRDWLTYSSRRPSYFTSSLPSSSASPSPHCRS